jgi:hypothetical protein
MTARTGQLGQGNGDGTTVEGQSAFGIWDRTTKTGQPRRVNLDRSAWTATTGLQRQENCRQDYCWCRAAGTGISKKTDGIVCTSRIGNRGRMARTGQLRQDYRMEKP